ncbi:hypothetical protein G7K_2287-t1 [Saitoella complicata NRRL Y-17804]|uniref:Uncharacterized protein n=1 Tax=Saitoella complicata (strain BCRC 22490 / CBS 7301 / JCM 7358 / NBRC 10748 / NRRL Y-17804) TaxID=698492 RepID=A0A0E9NFB5_SAICN|nr:hypothetical protein G7K_2287-t1 [Saitoella complicata NRRL Y-17804]
MLMHRHGGGTTLRGLFTVYRLLRAGIEHDLLFYASVMEAREARLARGSATMYTFYTFCTKVRVEVAQ